MAESAKLLASGAERHVRAFFGELLGNRLADPFTGPGDQRDLSF